MSKGWVKIHRQIQENFLFKERREFSKFEAWLTILLNCNHSKAEILISGQVFECGKGQSLNSIDTWAKLFNWKSGKVRTFFKLLIKQEMITTENLTKTTRLTVCNYERYQVREQPKRKQKTTKKQPKNKQKATNKNNKEEIKNENNINAYDFLIKNSSQELEVFEMQYKKTFNNYQKFIDYYNNKVNFENIEFTTKKLIARLYMLNTNWNKDKKENNSPTNVTI